MSFTIIFASKSRAMEESSRINRAEDLEGEYHILAELFHS